MKKQNSVLKQLESEIRQQTENGQETEDVQQAIAKGFGEYRRRLTDARVSSGIFSRASLVSPKT
jgi:hypothetical protein